MKSAVLVIAQTVFRDGVSRPAGGRDRARCGLDRDDVMVDGHIVTANGPGAAAAFGEALGDLMGLKDGEATP